MKHKQKDYMDHTLLRHNDVIGYLLLKTLDIEAQLRLISVYSYSSLPSNGLI